MPNLLFGGQLNHQSLRFVLVPVLACMAELEGGRLGGFYTETVVGWCMGKPSAAIPLLPRQKRLEDLIRVVYSRLATCSRGALVGRSRVDASRARLRTQRCLATLAYVLLLAGGPRDNRVVRWVRAQAFERLSATAQGVDRRRMDHDFGDSVPTFRREPA